MNRGSYIHEMAPRRTPIKPTLAVRSLASSKQWCVQTVDPCGYVAPPHPLPIRALHIPKALQLPRLLAVAINGYAIRLPRSCPSFYHTLRTVNRYCPSLGTDSRNMAPEYGTRKETEALHELESWSLEVKLVYSLSEDKTRDDRR